MLKTLNQALTLAKLQEKSLKTLQQELGPTKKPPSLPTSQYQSKFQTRNTPLLPKPNNPSTFVTKNAVTNQNTTRMRSSSDFDERRAKGLCFWCNDKYEVGHNCRRKQLYLMEVNEDSEDDNDQEGLWGDEKADEEEVNPQISVHAINGMGA